MSRKQQKSIRAVSLNVLVNILVVCIINSLVCVEDTIVIESLNNVYADHVHRIFFLSFFFLYISSITMQ